MTLLTVGSVGARVALESIKGSKKKSIELFGYDFVKLFQLIAISFVAGWIVEQYFKFLVGGTVVGGFLINLIRLANPAVPEFKPDTQAKIAKLFIGGYEVGGVKIKYWDIVKSVLVALVFAEWYTYEEQLKSAGGEPSPFTRLIFASLMILLGLATVPKFYNEIKVKYSG